LTPGCLIVLKRSLSNDFFAGKIAFFVSLGRIYFYISFYFEVVVVVVAFGGICGTRCCKEVRVEVII